MKRMLVVNAWNALRRKISVVLIVGMIVTGISPATLVYAKGNDV